jgi:hypothetical protein
MLHDVDEPVDNRARQPNDIDGARYDVKSTLLDCTGRETISWTCSTISTSSATTPRAREQSRGAAP